jgi:Tol biopolymer transport system component
MALAAGTRLGPYEVISLLGAGGMGEVYRARDTRLGRDVAVKVLPQHLAETDDARARLDREAKAISGLNHPHICTLFDLGHDGGHDYLVMELIEGETLTARLAKGPLPAEELLRLAIQVAEALDLAHRRGIIHRDLKPGNIMLTRSGAKLMDFGLARATAPDAAPGDLASAMTMSRSLTAQGVLVGTFLYMSPEQLEGKEADARSDLWALGCVMYEMATGKRAFDGQSQASLIGAIMHTEPVSVASAAPLASPGLDRVVKSCLAKDPEERIQTAHDVKLQLRWVAEGGSQAGASAPVMVRRRHRERLPWLVAAVFALAAIGTTTMGLTRREPAPEVTRFTLDPPAGARTMNWPRISPNGRQLAYLAADTLGRTMIWLRPMGALQANPLPGTEDAGRPFWSPDSRYLAYFDGNQLKKIAVAGGPPQLICETKSAADGAWSTGDIIMFDGAAGDSLRQVSANGGVASPATVLDRKAGESQHAWPWFLPDGKHYLYLAFGSAADGNWTLKAGEIGSTEAVTLGTVDSRVEFAAPDLVLYAIEGTLMARRLDLGSWKWKSDPFPVAERVLVRNNSQANFSVSDNGVLVTMRGGSTERSELVWMDRTGKRLGREGAAGAYRDLDLSPDGTRLAYGLVDGKAGTQDLWVRDLKRGVSSRLTFGDGNEIWPTWSPDGRDIAFGSDASGAYSVRRQPADGTGVESPVYGTNQNTGPSDWSGDARTLVLTAYPQGNADLWTCNAEGGGDAREVLGTPFNESQGQLAPDGRWLAYTSMESGVPEVYVRAFPGPGGKWQISNGGGGGPQWRGDGRELFFRANRGTTLMAVTIDAGAAFQAGTPARLFEVSMTGGDPVRNRYVAAADGQRFLVNVPQDAAGLDVFNVVLNWTAEVTRK